MSGVELLLKVAVVAFVVGLQVTCCVKGCLAVRRKLLARYCRRPEGRPQESDESPEVLELLSKLLATRRLDCAKHTAFFLWVLTCFLGVQITGELFGEEGMIATKNAVAPRVLAMVVISPPALFPRILSSESAAVAFYLAFMSVLCAMAAMQKGEGLQIRVSDGLSTVALMASGLFPRFRSVLIPNICFTGCQLFSHASANIERHEVAKTVSYDVGLLLIRLSLCYWGDIILELFTRKEVEASFGTCHQSAVSALLGMTCDAVVELDEAFLFTADFPKVKGMLMLSSGKSLRGQSLGSFAFDEQERARLEAALKSSTPAKNTQDVPVQGMISCSLRDSIGNKIATTLLDVPYISAGGQARHLIGLREDTEVVGQFDGCASAGHASAPRQPEGFLRPEVVERLNTESPAPLRPGFSRRSHSSKSSGSRRSEKPSADRTTELLLCEKLPAVWIADGLRCELGLAPPVSGPHGGCLPEFGGLLPDGGTLLLNEINSRIDQEQMKGSEGNFVVELGDWTLATSGEATKYKLWLSFFLSLRCAEDIPFVGLSVCRPKLRFTGQGPADLGGTAAIGKRRLIGSDVRSL